MVSQRAANVQHLVLRCSPHRAERWESSEGGVQVQYHEFSRGGRRGERDETLGESMGDVASGELNSGHQMRRRLGQGTGDGEAKKREGLGGLLRGGA